MGKRLQILVGKKRCPALHFVMSLCLSSLFIVALFGAFVLLLLLLSSFL